IRPEKKRLTALYILIHHRTRTLKHPTRYPVKRYRFKNSENIESAEAKYPPSMNYCNAINSAYLFNLSRYFTHWVKLKLVSPSDYFPSDNHVLALIRSAIIDRY
ncbi:MAG: hypothetical protein ACRDC9_10545, partial [Plesiomonas shigelloides]